MLRNYHKKKSKMEAKANSLSRTKGILKITPVSMVVEVKAVEDAVRQRKGTDGIVDATVVMDAADATEIGIEDTSKIDTGETEMLGIETGREVTVVGEIEIGSATEKATTRMTVMDLHILTQTKVPAATVHLFSKEEMVLLIVNFLIGRLRIAAVNGTVTVTIRLVILETMVADEDLSQFLHETCLQAEEETSLRTLYYT